MSGCRFSDCNATEYDGGGIRDISFLAVRSCYIHSCHASRYHGGGIHWRYPTNEQVSLSEWILDCVFENNSATGSAHDMHVLSTGFNGTESIFDEMCYNLDQENRLCMSYDGNNYYYDDWLPYRKSTAFGGSIYVDSSLTFIIVWSIV